MYENFWDETFSPKSCQCYPVSNTIVNLVCTYIAVDQINKIVYFIKMAFGVAQKMV